MLPELRRKANVASGIVFMFASSSLKWRIWILDEERSMWKHVVLVTLTDFRFREYPHVFNVKNYEKETTQKLWDGNWPDKHLCHRLAVIYTSFSWFADFIFNFANTRKDSIIMITIKTKETAGRIVKTAEEVLDNENFIIFIHVEYYMRR